MMQPSEAVAKRDIDTDLPNIRCNPHMINRPSLLCSITYLFGDSEIFFVKSSKLQRDIFITSQSVFFKKHLVELW